MRTGTTVGRRAPRHRIAGVALAASTMALATMVASPALASHISCGASITTNTTLDGDIGPCDGPGLFIDADNITLNLNGFSVIGDPVARSGGVSDALANDAPGVAFRGVSGSTLTHGTITGFDAGVVIRNGGHNTVRRVTARDNINYRVVTGIDFDDDPQIPGRPEPCIFGDGIVTFGSSNNVIKHNTIAHNGPLSGIALVGNSDHNRLANNQLRDNDVVNQVQSGPNTGENTVCGTTSTQGPMTAGRSVQAIGVRVEGPGAQSNRVVRNTVRRSALAGIAIHGYVCDNSNAPPGVPVGENNGHNTIKNNTVMATGFRTVGQDSQANGISALQQGPPGTVCVSDSNSFLDNFVFNNRANGMYFGGRGTHDNVISGNTANVNYGDGIHVTDGAVHNTLHNNQAFGNHEFDGFDGNAGCDDNDWSGNQFINVNEACVAHAGQGWVRGPGARGSRRGAP